MAKGNVNPPGPSARKRAALPAAKTLLPRIKTGQFVGFYVPPNEGQERGMPADTESEKNRDCPAS